MKADLTAIHTLLRENIGNQTLFRVILSGAQKQNRIQKVTIRPIEIAKKICFQISEQVANQVLHRNVPSNEIAEIISNYLSSEFHQALISTAELDYQVLKSKKGAFTLIKQKATQTSPSLKLHNRPKKYILEEGTPIDFLVKLGIMNGEGKLIAKKTDKFRQINRFLEIIDDILDHFPIDKKLRIIDFGCGKSYLSFALYYYLTYIKKYSVLLTGLDLKKDVIAFCSDLAKELQYDNLNFEVGDINHYQPKSTIDMVVCLHACDTATDAALENSVLWNAKVILAVPCCQHELLSQINNATLAPLLRHGILKEKFSALVTDAARAEILEILGYKCQIMEFIDMEHTPKNLLIRAVRMDQPKQIAKNKNEYAAFTSMLSIKPSLEKRLKNNIGNI